MAAPPVFYALFRYAPQSIKSCRCLSCARLRVATGCGAVMPFAEKKSKSHAIPLLPCSSQPSYIRNPKAVTGGYTR